MLHIDLLSSTPLCNVLYNFSCIHATSKFMCFAHDAPHAIRQDIMSIDIISASHMTLYLDAK